MPKIKTVEQGLEAFHNEVRQPTSYPGVYTFYLKETGEPLYVGRTKNVHQRLLDHFVIEPNNTELRSKLQEDEDIDFQVTGGELWSHIQWKWIHVEDKALRRDLEKRLESELDPRYPTR